MKKYIKSYVIFWAILLALFNVIAFVSPGWIGYEKYVGAFWAGYVFIMISFVGQLICAIFTLRETNATKLFYKLPILTISYTGLIVAFVVGGLCMLFYPLKSWICILACVITLAAVALPIVKVSAAADAVAEIDKKVKANTFFIRSLTVDAETLMNKASTSEAKTAAKEVYEAVRYSDPMSNPALASDEAQITIKFNEFSNAITNGVGDATELGEELLVLLKARNSKCKLLK